MSLGQHQRVAAGERADVEDREIAAVLVDPDGRSLPGDDRTEHAGHVATVLDLSETAQVNGIRCRRGPY